MNEVKKNKKQKLSDGRESGEMLPEIKHECTIEVLNHHCLGEIYSYLCTKDRLNLEKVSTKLKDASDLAWRRIKDLNLQTTWYTNSRKQKPLMKQNSIKDYQNQLIAKHALTRCGKYLETLSLNYLSASKFMPIIIKNCHNLRKLVIYFGISGDKYNDAFENMVNLKCLDLQSFEGNNTELFKSLPESIEEISIKKSYCTQSDGKLIFSEDFENIANKWKALHSLSLKWYKFDENMAAIFFNPNYPLIHLTLEWCYNVYVDVQSRILRYVNLKHLSLHKCQPVDDNFVTAIVKNLKNLTHLNLNNCNSVSSMTLKTLGQLQNLTEIFLNRTNANDSVLAEFKNLKILKCSATSVSDIGVIKVLDNSPYLEHLHIHDTKITENFLRHASNLTNCRERKLSIYCEKYIIINAFRQRNEISAFLTVNHEDKDRYL